MSDSSFKVKASDSDDKTVQHERVIETVKNSTTRSLGTRKAELLNEQYQSPHLKVCLFVSIFFVAYTYGIESTLRGNIQAYATSSYTQHSLLSTVNVIKSVVAAASQPMYARLSDKFGRLELMLVSIVFYIVGTVIQSQAFDINRFAGGSVLYQVGFSGVMIMLQIILADFSNLNWRLVCSFVPALPFIINTWVAAEVQASLLANHSWNFAIGIWAFIFPLSCVPLLLCFIHMIWKARKTDEWQRLKEERTKTPFIQKAVELFWELDVVGIVLLVCVFGFILVPFTIAGGVTDKWKEASFYLGPFDYRICSSSCFRMVGIQICQVSYFSFPVIERSRSLVSSYYCYPN